LCRNVSPLQVLNQEKSGVLCSGISGDLCSGISGVLSSGIGGVLCSGIVVHFVAESWRPLQRNIQAVLQDSFQAFDFQA